MKRLALVVCAAAAVLAFPVRALAQPVHPADSPKTTLTLSEDLAVGNITLKPGEYRFQCRTFEGKTFLVVSSVETGKEIARVPCVRESLAEKVKESEFVMTQLPTGMRKLTLVRIKNDMAAHRLVD